MKLPQNINQVTSYVDKELYSKAVGHYHADRFDDAIVELGRAFDTQTSSMPEGLGISVTDAYALHLRCLLHQKRFDEFDRVVASFDLLSQQQRSLVDVVVLWREVERGEWEVVHEIGTQLLSEKDSFSYEVLAELYFLLSYANANLGQLRSAVTHSELARSLFLVAGNETRSAYVCNYLGMLNRQISRYTFSVHWFKEALALFGESHLPRKLSMVHLNTAVTHYKTGNYRASLEHLEESLRIGVEGGWVHRQCFAHLALGNVHRLRRKLATARRHLHTAYGQAQQLGYAREEALALEFLGDVYRDEGQHDAALRFYTRARALAETQAPEGDIVMEVHRREGECLVAKNDLPGATEAFRRALSLARAQGDRFEEGVILRCLADVAFKLDDRGTARRRIDRSTDILGGIGARHEHAISLLASAELALVELDTDPAGGGRERLDAAWQDATLALERMLAVDVPWWTGQARRLVERVGRRRAARERAERDGTARGASYAPGDVIIHTSGCMRDLLRVTDMFAVSHEPVLLAGETGTGKELLARRLHEVSGRGGELVTVNVAAIPETMFEREFFGHVRGAFSGADRDGTGYAARADGGTLFLDEIGDLPIAMQPKLLRLLQEGTYQAIGDPAERRSDIRLVAATNADLAQRVADGRFREDLWYRLRVLELTVPPVRERPEDVLPLLRHFICRAEGRYVDLADYFDRASLDAAERWSWPGNVREIAMVARRAQVARRSGAPVRVELVDRDGHRLVLTGGQPLAMAAREGAPTPDDHERRRILRALEACDGHRIRAAEVLGIGRSTLYRRMEKLGIPTSRRE